MNKTVLIKVTSKLGKKANRAIFHLKKYTPEICLGLGLACVGGAVVTSARAGYKVAKKVNESNVNKESKVTEVEKAEVSEAIENEESKKGITDKVKNAISSETTRYAIKEFSIPVALGLAGSALIISSHGVMAKRNATALAAYVSLEQAYSRLKKKSESKDIQSVEESEKAEPDNKKNDEGLVLKVSKDELDWLDYRFSDSDHFAFFEDVYNEQFLKSHEEKWNLVLSTRGYVILNEVYADLGLPQTAAGAIKGWTDYADDKLVYIDFGIIPSTIMDPERKLPSKDFLLSFNVNEGNIFDQI